MHNGAGGSGSGLREEPELLAVGFNQDAGCFAAGTSAGFRIFNCEPFKETFRREFDQGGVALVEMLFRCNILALVGGGPKPKYAPNKVMIWDDHQSRCIGELSFRSDVRAVRLRRDRIVVVLEHKIYVYNFADLKLLHQIETLANAKGLVALSPTASSMVLACPGLHKGQVRVELYDTKRTKFVAAHESALATLALSPDGTRLATASERGTLVRIFDTADGSAPLQELRRGADRCCIFSVAFSPSCEWLALTSDKGTLHVYALEAGAGGSGRGGAPQGQESGLGSGDAEEDLAVGGAAGASPGSAARNKSSSLSWLGIGPVKNLMPKYFNSEWSFAQLRLPDASKRLVQFGARNTLLILGENGTFATATFDTQRGGECTQQSFCKFLRTEDQAEPTAA